MKRFLTILCSLLLSGLLIIPVFAEDQGKPVLTDWFYISHEENEARDEEFADREYNMGRELTEDEYNPNETGAAPPESGEATPEEIAAYEEYMREQEEIAHDSNLIAKPARNKLMDMVFSDDVDQVHAPENCFDDKYAEYKGKDGSVTRVYDNGSVATKYADGSYEAFDTWGNHYTTDKDDVMTVQLTDGNTLIDLGNGYFEWHGQDGSVVTPHEDGTFSWKNQSGIVIDYNEDGERVAIGFENGEKIDLPDGMFPQGDGELKGPKGASITWHNGSTYLGDNCYSFKVVGEDGRGGSAYHNPNSDLRVDEEATRAKKLETNGEFKDFVMTDDVSVEVSSMDGKAWKITLNNTRDDVGVIVFENSDGDVYTNKYLGDGLFQKSYVSGDGKERYSISMDDNGVNAFYKDESGEHNLIKTTLDEDGNVVLTYEDGGKYIINDEGGISDYISPEGKKIHVTTDGDNQRVEYSDPKKGVFFTEVNGEIVSGSGPIGGGYKLTIKDGEMEIVSPKGEKVKVTEYSDGSMSATLADGTKLTKDPDGNWMRDGKPLDEPTETEETGVADIEDFMGTWYWTETTTGKNKEPKTVYYSWTLTNEGDYITMVLTVTSDDEPETDTFKCDYSFDGTTLTLRNEILGGGRTTVVKDGENLRATGHGEGNSTVTMHR